MPVRVDPEGFEINALIEYIGSLADKRVLEIGAGDGRLTWRYAGQAAHITALDPDASRMAIAQEELPETLRDRVTLLPVTVEEFDPSSGSRGFDVAIMSWSP